MIKNNFRILKKQYAYFQTIFKTSVKFQKDSPKTVGGVADTRYILHIHICSIRARKMSKLKIAPSRANNCEVTDPIRPESKLVRDFMPVLDTSKFDEDPIKNERASLETSFFHYKYMGNFSDAQGHLTL